MKANVKKRKPQIGEVYKTISTPTPIYGYIRGIKYGDVGFSVLDYPTSYPDFSDCGIFWVPVHGFFKVFEKRPCQDVNFKDTMSTFSKSQHFGM